MSGVPLYPLITPVGPIQEPTPPPGTTVESKGLIGLLYTGYTTSCSVADEFETSNPSLFLVWQPTNPFWHADEPVLGCVLYLDETR
jgi:hypothetical protein